MKCQKCGAEFEDSEFCPVCGARQTAETPVETPVEQPAEWTDTESTEVEQKPKKNIFALIGLIASIAGLFISPFGLIRLAGFILSIVGVVKAKKTGNGKGMAIAGIIISVAGVVLAILGTIICIILFVNVLAPMLASM